MSQKPTETKSQATNQKEKVAVKQNISDGHFFIACIIVACLIIPFLYYATQVYLWAHENKPAGYKYPEVKQLWMTAVGMCTFKMMQEFIYCVTRPIFRRLMAEQPDEITLEKKVDKACYNLNGFVYHTTATMWGYHVLKNSTWLPWFLGGLHPQGAFTFETLFIATPPGVHCYILFTYGYHVLNFLNHLVAEKNNDWRTMLLHHIAAIALYPGLIFGGLMGAGVVAAWLHDIADIAVTTCRIFNTLDWKWTSTFAYFAMVVIWFYTRLVILPYYIWLSIKEFKFPEVLAHYQPFIYIEIFFVSIMQVLHVFWFAMFMRMGYRMLVKGERKDIIHQVQPESNEKPKDK